MSKPNAEIRPYEEIQSLKKGGLLRYAENGDQATTFIIGNVTLDEQAGKWLTDLLPPLIAFRTDRSKSSSSMRAVLEILSRECQFPNMGSTVVASRLADILFVEAIRAYVEEAGGEAAGWLRALTDSKLSTALSAVHGALDRRWTVASLAETAGLSRSAFAPRFKEVLGETPLDYLTRLRMYKAAQMLRESDVKIARVANMVGYESEGSFSKVFKATIGLPPGAYRGTFREIRQEALL
jgi:AraC-like DNA-binding protein